MEDLGKLGSSPSAYDCLYGLNTLVFYQERFGLYISFSLLLPTENYNKFICCGRENDL